MQVPFQLFPQEVAEVAWYLVALPRAGGSHVPARVYGPLADNDDQVSFELQDVLDEPQQAVLAVHVELKLGDEAQPCFAGSQ